MESTSADTILTPKRVTTFLASLLVALCSGTNYVCFYPMASGQSSCQLKTFKLLRPIPVCFINAGMMHGGRFECYPLSVCPTTGGPPAAITRQTEPGWSERNLCGKSLDGTFESAHRNIPQSVCAGLDLFSGNSPTLGDHDPLSLSLPSCF